MVKFIADISSNHCGSLNKAKELIYKAKESGADFAKFQYWETENFIDNEVFKRINLGHQKKWNESVFNIYKKYQVSEDWIPILYDECNKIGIEFLLSCYELSKIDVFDKYVKTWKIGSGDIDYIPILVKIGQKNKDVFLGCGSVEMNEIYNSDATLKMNGAKSTIWFQCNTNYSAEDKYNIKYLNMKAIRPLRAWDYDIYFEGLSDHTKSDIPIISSITLGVRYIERHFKLDDNDSPDSSFSLNPSEWMHMVDIAWQTIDALGSGEKIIQDNEQECRIIQRRDKTTWKRPDNEAYNKWLKNIYSKEFKE